MTDQKVMCCLCCASDPIIASLTIDRQGFVPGEVIVFNSDIDNQSDRMMSCSKARLIMVSLHVSILNKSENATLIF